MTLCLRRSRPRSRWWSGSPLRLKLYLAITTLAFSFIINHVILYTESVTHGPNGIFVNGAKILGFDVQREAPLYYPCSASPCSRS